jgi:Carboxypeptidase regulatory-like domain
MSRLRFVLLVWLTSLCALFLICTSLRAQTASTSTVTGTVTDPRGGAVPAAKVELLDQATGDKSMAITGDDGHYQFPAVPPGTYKITVTGSGFRQAVLSNIRVEVGRSALVNVPLELGQITEVVEVVATGAVQLQTLNSSVGNTLDANLLSQLPTLNRDATSLLLLQPMAIPGFNGPGGSGESNNNGGAVAGARADQNTFMIDGGDATSNMEGGGGYNTGFQATPRAVVPTPVESLEEFRVQTNNAGVDYSRSGGAEVQMVTRRGTNQWHGAGYWYHQNDELNANDWFRNNGFGDPSSAPVTNPEWRDNRYGGRLAGPIWKDRTFFFLHEEERHFFTQSVFSRLVPTAALRAGILKFKDGSGAVNSYNLNGAPVVDPDTGSVVASSGLDPRGLGVSPAIAATWALLPMPNDFSGGDGLRSAFFTSTSQNTTNEHFAVARIDHKINDKFDFMVSYRFGKSDIIPANIQEDIGGVAPGCRQGVPCAIANRPLQPRYLVTGLTARLTPNVVNDFHFNWLRHWWSWVAPGARILPISSSLSDAPIQIWQESRVNGMVPINLNTQQARERAWNGQDYTFTDNLTWIRGKHVWTFGGRAQIEHFLHIRDDKVVGGLASPLYFAAYGGDFTSVKPVSLGSAPPLCADNTTGTNCLRPQDTTNWNRAYVSTLGIIESGTQVLTRDGNLNAQPPLTPITQHENVTSYELHFSDTWRISSSLTFTYGLTWGVQMPPYDPTGKTAMMIDAGTGKPIDSKSYLGAKEAAALNGDVFNPTLGFVPIKATGRKYPYDPDYTNWGPRLALAWNPNFSDGLLHSLFGNGKTVIRGGWARAFDRINGVGVVLTPALGIGFGDLSVCRKPSLAGVCEAGGTAADTFRIGVDGSHLDMPALPAVSGGVIIPGVNSIYENRDFRLDPRRQIGGTDMFDLTVQRELPGNLLLEVGYVGRLARDLTQNIDLNHVPYMFTPKGVNQSYAQAFDAVAAEIQAGVAPASVTPQPWFEHMLGAGGTAAAADSEEGYFATHGAGAAWLDLESSFITGPMTASANQIASIDWTKSNGYSNYHAGFITLRKRPTHGLAFDVNYTLSHSLDTLGLTQENTCAVTDAYKVDRSYAPSLFDRRHIFNALVNYELPFGKGKGMATSGIADKIFGGWNVSGVYTMGTGLPMMVYDFGACGSEFGSTPFNGAPIGLIKTSSGSIGTSRHNNPTIGNFGTNSAPGGFPNAFSNPDAVRAQFRYPTFADNRIGLGAVRGLLRWNFDFGVSKTTHITERVSTRFDVQFVNAFNHPMLGGGTSGQYFNAEANADISTPETFGVLGQQFNSPRYIQIGLRFDF